MLGVEHYLSTHACARGLSQEELSALAKRVQLLEVRSEDVLLEAGSFVEQIYLVVHGRFRLATRANSVHHLAAYAGPGDQIGALAMFRNEPVSFDVIADEPSLVIQIPASVAREALGGTGRLGRNLLGRAGMRLAELALGGKQAERNRAVGVIHFAEQPSFTPRIVERLSSLDETMGVITNASLANMGVPCCSLPESNDPDFDQRLKQSIERWTDYRRIIMDWELDSVTDERVILQRMVSAMESVFWVVNSENASAAIEIIRSLTAETEAGGEKTNWIWELDDDEQVAPVMADAAEALNRIFIVRSASRSLTSTGSDPSFERIVHYLRGIQLGIALGGGAARGMAHLGVLKQWRS